MHLTSRFGSEGDTTCCMHACIWLPITCTHKACKSQYAFLQTTHKFTSCRAFCTVDGSDSSTSPQVMGELDFHSGQTRHRWPGCQAVVTKPNSIVTMGFSIVNSGSSQRLATIFSDVSSLTRSVLNASGNSAWDPVASQANNLLSSLFPDCDGLVAADGVYFAVSNFTAFSLFQNQGFQRSYVSTHCSEASRYSVGFLAVLLGPA